MSSRKFYWISFKILFEFWFWSVSFFYFCSLNKRKVRVNFDLIVRDFVKCCAEHMKECCILRDKCPLSHIHCSGGYNCFKEIRFTLTSLQNLVLILLLYPFIRTFSYIRIIVNEYLSCINIDCEIIEFQYILCPFELALQGLYWIRCSCRNIYFNKYYC